MLDDVNDAMQEYEYFTWQSRIPNLNTDEGAQFAKALQECIEIQEVIDTFSNINELLECCSTVEDAINKFSQARALQIMAADLAVVFRDTYSVLERYYTRKIAKILNGVNTKEGAVYSPDGRYVALTDARLYYSDHNASCGNPILIDLATGEVFLVAAYSNKTIKDEAFGVAIAACFSSDNRYFYYILYGDFGESKHALYRYDLQKGNTELCLILDGGIKTVI